LQILADHLASPVDRIDRYVYDKCPPYAVSWSYRLELLLLELQGYDADVMCLQEVQKDHFDDSLCPRLREIGYDGIFTPRNTGAYAYTSTILYSLLLARMLMINANDTGALRLLAELAPEKVAQGRCPDGVAIFFRSARLELVEQDSVVYRTAAAAAPRHGPSDSSDDESEEDTVPDQRGAAAAVVIPQQGDLRRTIMDNEGGALLALLRFVGTGAQVCCASTHLWHEPTRPDVRCVQAALLCKAVHQMAQRAGPGTGVVVCGDFNSEPAGTLGNEGGGGGGGGGVYELLSTGRLRTDHEDHPVTKHTTNGMPDLTCDALTSAYALSGRVSEPAMRPSSFRWLPILTGSATQEPTCTMKDHRGARCLDYLWLGGAARLVRTLRMPYGGAQSGDAGAAASFPRIPNRQWPSDHLAIGAEILLPMRHADE
jgi:endonuclease/exonuclease/phosphatase family metal-dependent hydrolase